MTSDPESRPPRCTVCLTPDPSPYASAWDVPLWACGRCRSAFVWPVPTEEELRARYAREHAAGKWEEIFREAPAGDARRRLELLGEVLGGPGRLLDVGCGNAAFLAAAGAAGWTAVGSEIEEEALRERHRHASVSCFVGTPEALVAEPRFDAVTFWDVLEHVADPLALLEQAVARLRPGGVVAATMPNRHGTTAWLHGPAWKYYEPAAYGHLHHLSLRGLATLVRRAGLETVREETTGSTDLRYVPEVRWGRTPGRLTAAVLDRLSGALARVAPARGYGDTSLVVGRLSASETATSRSRRSTASAPGSP